MLNFNEVRLEDKEWVDQLLSYSNYMGTEYCFTTLYTWRDVYKTQICRYKDFLLIRSNSGKTPHYIFPAGKGNDSELKEVIELYQKDAKENFESPLKIVSVLNESKTKLEELFPDMFAYEHIRNSFDYIYNSIDLITLKGKKFQSKRNHLARFIELPNWSYESVTLENIAECEEMNDEWCVIYGCNRDKSMAQEADAVKECLHNFYKLGLQGGLLRLDGKVVAYTLGERLNSETYIVHVEKAFADIRGAYPSISRLFLLNRLCEEQMRVEGGKYNEAITESDIEFKYINREDDAGDEGLRKAKMQNNPTFLLEKWIAKMI